jgi:hypothetical protein
MTEETETEMTEETATEGTEETVKHRETEERRKNGQFFLIKRLCFFSVRVLRCSVSLCYTVLSVTSVTVPSVPSDP